MAVLVMRDACDATNVFLSCVDGLEGGEATPVLAMT
jgi:hypothetical protein